MHFWLIVGLGLTLAGCAATPRLPASGSRLNTAVPAGFDGQEEIRFAFDSEEAFLRHSAQTFAELERAAEDGRVNILSLSGGGAGGAFGAGALVGWTRSGTRPAFQLVTGVSVGALIAPLAFLGPDWDPVLTRALGGGSTEHLMQRNLIGTLFGNSSVYRGEPLRDLVDAFLSDALLEAVAREYRRGRRLFIETTDLDKGEPVIWDMGAIALHGGKKARTLFRDVLVASASIPVVFPPVVIRVREDGRSYDEMHVDGATTVPLFLGPEVSALVTRGAPHLENFKAYVLVNGQLGRFPSTTKISARRILARGFDTNLTHGIRAALALAYNFADHYGMQFELTAVPTGYPFKGPLDFEPAHMRALFDFAAHCAETGRLWKTLGAAYHDGMTTRAPERELAPECPAAAMITPQTPRTPEAPGAAAPGPPPGQTQP